MTNNALKSHLIKSFSAKYGTMRDYYDRFFELYSVFFVLALLCQLWAGWAEAHFFGTEMNGIVAFPSSAWALGAGLAAAFLFELTKTKVGHKLLQEFYGAQNKLHASLLGVWMGMMCLSALIGYIGIGNYTTSHRITNQPTDTLTAKIDALYLPQIEQVQSQIDGLTRKYTWKNKYNGIPATSWAGGPSQAQLNEDRAMMQSLEKRLALLQEQYLRERQQAQGNYVEAMADYRQETAKKVFSGRFFTIITELIYALCLWYNAFFASQAARTVLQTITDLPTDPRPIGQHQGGNYPAISPRQSRFNGRRFTPLPLNEKTGQKLDSDAEAQKANKETNPETRPETPIATRIKKVETVVETRTCAHCSAEFKVDTRRDSISRPKKYCSPECLNESRKINNQLRRAKAGKWKIIKNELGTPSRSIMWGNENKQKMQAKK